MSATIAINSPAVSPNTGIAEAPASCCRINVKVHSVALRILAQVGIALAINFAVMTFVATPITMVVVTTMLALSTIHWGYWAIVRNKKRKQEEQAQQTSRLSMMSLASTAATAGTGILIHEEGHAIASMACFKNAEPSIKIRPFRGGVTTFNIGGPFTRFGRLLGPRGSMILIGGAGIAASTLSAIAGLAIADRIKESYPCISDLLTGHAITQLASEIFYGFSTFFLQEINLSHDFQRLWVMGGINPLIPIALMIIIPVIQALVFRKVFCSSSATR